MTGIRFLLEVTVASFDQFIYPISFHRYTLVENPEISILQNWISMRPVSSLTGNHLLPYQGVTMIQKIGNQDKVVTFDPCLSFDFKAKSFVISKCKDKWWNLHFSVRFLISYSLIDDVINWPSFRRLMLGKQNSSLVVMIFIFW